VKEIQHLREFIIVDLVLLTQLGDPHGLKVQLYEERDNLLIIETKLVRGFLEPVPTRLREANEVPLPRFFIDQSN